MKTFMGTKYTKKELIARVQHHYDADGIVQGKYWKNDKGGCVGCWLHSDDHPLFEEYYGVPKELAFLADSIFGVLPTREAKEFPLELAKSIPVGVDLGFVWNRFAVWLLVDPHHGVIRFNSCSIAIRDVAKLHQRIIYGDEVSVTEWDAVASTAAAEAARASAREAVALTAAAAAAAAAVSAAKWYAKSGTEIVSKLDAVLAVVSAAEAAAEAAGSARAAAAAAAERVASRIAQKNKLIELVKDAK